MEENHYCQREDPDWYPVLAGLRYTPFRREELCFLEWTDLDLNKDLITIQDEKPAYDWRPKRSGRIMDLHPTLREVLRSLPRKGSFVFRIPGRRGTIESIVQERSELGRRAWRKIKVLCDHLELAEKDPTGSWYRRFPKGANLKAFRSGISCELQLKGAPLAYVQEQLGHHDQSITLEHYTHIVPELMGDLTKQFISRLGGQ